MPSSSYKAGGRSLETFEGNPELAAVWSSKSGKGKQEDLDVAEGRPYKNQRAGRRQVEISGQEEQGCVGFG
jgi:hypothetical protein